MLRHGLVENNDVYPLSSPPPPGGRQLTVFKVCFRRGGMLM